MVVSLEPTLVAMVALGGVTATAYVVHGVRRRVGSISLAKVVTVFWGSGAMVMGAKLCQLSTIAHESLRGLSDHRVSLFLAGLCVVWLGIDSVRRAIARVPHDADRPEGKAD